MRYEVYGEQNGGNYPIAIKVIDKTKDPSCLWFTYQNFMKLGGHSPWGQREVKSGLFGIKLLYSFPRDIINADPQTPVYICEGMKDACTVRNMGLLATNFPHGTQVVKKEDAVLLARRKIVCVCDNDEAGIKRGKAIGAEYNADVIFCKDFWKQGEPPNHADITDYVELVGQEQATKDLLSATVRHYSKPKPLPKSKVYYDTSNLDELKRINLIEWAEEQGMKVRNKKASCIFHAEKTPSLCFFQHEGIWRFRCYGCGESGTILDLAMQLWRVDLKGAIEEIGKPK